jgi:ADP-heptose:LPS heptosyltransferase
MPRDNFFSNLLNTILKKSLALKENKNRELGNPKKFLIVRQHNQLGDLLGGVSLFRAIKETYPGSEITLILSPVNYQGLIKNKYIDKLFIFNKSRLFNPGYFNNLLRVLRGGYDVAVVPVVVSISFTSNLLARLSDAKIRIGASSLDGKINKSSYLFDRHVDVHFSDQPDSNVAERSLEVVRPFGITTKNLRSEISFDQEDNDAANAFIKSLNIQKSEYLIGFHAGAGKSQNRWSLYKYIKLMEEIAACYPVKFYLTGSSKDREENSFIRNHCSLIAGEFINKPIPQVAALVAASDLFICNDTGIMHVAGTTDTPQISLFGPTNPFNWAPIGNNKIFIKRSDLIDDIETEDVLSECKRFLSPGGKAG